MASNTDINCMRGPDSKHEYRQLWYINYGPTPFAAPDMRFYCIYCLEETPRP